MNDWSFFALMFRPSISFFGTMTDHPFPRMNNIYVYEELHACNECPCTTDLSVDISIINGPLMILQAYFPGGRSSTVPHDTLRYSVLHHTWEQTFVVIYII